MWPKNEFYNEFRSKVHYKYIYTFRWYSIFRLFVEYLAGNFAGKIRRIGSTKQQQKLILLYTLMQRPSPMAFKWYKFSNYAWFGNLFGLQFQSMNITWNLVLLLVQKSCQNGLKFGLFIKCIINFGECFGLTIPGNIIVVCKNILKIQLNIIITNVVLFYCLLRTFQFEMTARPDYLSGVSFHLKIIQTRTTAFK